jgi:polar amino acid transport system substrate-binding protein
MKSLKGKTIGTIRNYAYSDAFNQSTEFKREEVPDFIQNIRKLTMKRIDMAIEDEIVAKARMKAEDPKLLEQVRFTKNPFSTNELYMASGLSNPRHKELVDAFNKGLDVIKGNGTYAKIMESYGIK